MQLPTNPAPVMNPRQPVEFFNTIQDPVTIVFPVPMPVPVFVGLKDHDFLVVSGDDALPFRDQFLGNERNENRKCAGYAGRAKNKSLFTTRPP
jgi:hypothetical protein